MAVAAATTGFAGDMHIPNGMMFTRGTWSMMFASGTSLVITRLIGSTTSELGAMPMVHVIIAPIQTWLGITAPHSGTPAVRRREIEIWGSPLSRPVGSSIGGTRRQLFVAAVIRVAAYDAASSCLR